MNLDAEIALHRNRIVELKANILDAREELEREQMVLLALEAVAQQPAPEAAPQPQVRARRAGAQEG
ncbi:MAG: hypothetical protein KGK07_07475 [Chloroflexota bacterium]|nr:hypothetical protein [Chloroflexota bacterium]